MVVMLKHCCCGCTLKTGTLIIAVVFAILSGLHILVFSLAASETAHQVNVMRLTMEMEDEGDKSVGQTTTAHPRSATSEDDATSQPPISVETRITVLTVWMWMSVIIVLMEFGVLLINIFLMFAANKENGRMVYAWVLGFGALSCCLQILHLVLVGLIFYVGSAVAAAIIIVYILLKTAGAAYSTLVGYSYHRQLVGTAVARRISRQDD